MEPGPPNSVSKKPRCWEPRGRRPLILRAAIVLGERADHGLALHVILAALPAALEVRLRAVDTAAHLLDLRR